MPAFTRSELADLNVFMTIVRRRSFRHSAQELGVSTSALSHSMRNLEARLGVKLLNRTSRSVVPTDAGSALAAKLEDGFQVIGEALGELDAYRTSPVGRLRLNVPRDASRLLLGPVLRRFTEAYPDLQLELSVEDRMVDIVADGYDAGIRYGGTVPQDMVAVPLTGELRWVVAASPDYLARHGVPQRAGRPVAARLHPHAPGRQLVLQMGTGRRRADGRGRRARPFQRQRKQYGGRRGPGRHWPGLLPGSGNRRGAA